MLLEYRRDRLALGMRCPGLPMPAGSDFHPIADDHRADWRVWRGAPDSFPSLLDRSPHPLLMIAHPCEMPCLCRGGNSELEKLPENGSI